MKTTMFNRILVYSLFAAVTLWVFSCSDKQKSGKIEVTTEKTEPQFKAEGSLVFISENDTIKKIEIEIADNTSDRMRGLMYRSSMDYNKGMLFIFDEEEEQSFWMKNTKMSLDIMYVNGDREIVSIYKHTQPYSESPIPSIKPAIYVIETAAGFSDKFGIEIGDKVEFSRKQVPA